MSTDFYPLHETESIVLTNSILLIDEYCHVVKSKSRCQVLHSRFIFSFLMQNISLGVTSADQYLTAYVRFVYFMRINTFSFNEKNRF